MTYCFVLSMWGVCVCVSVAEGEGIITLEEGFCEAVTEMAFAAHWPAGFVCEVP